MKFGEKRSKKITHYNLIQIDVAELQENEFLVQETLS